MTQNLRRSQFITTYGPGAILEGPDGPKIVPSLEQSEIFDSSRRPSDFEIRDLRLSQALLGGAGIVRLPSNAELGEPDSSGIYRTKRFPTWSLCTRHRILYRKNRSDNQACPQCSGFPSPGDAWSQANRQAIRFVRACPAGHLDEVDWNYLVHRGASCSATWLQWQGGGGALRNINIRCPVCSRETNLGLAYSQAWPCSGRFPEQEPVSVSAPIRAGCTEDSKILQRGAANLRISELVSALTIPPRSTQLHRLLEIQAIRIALRVTHANSKQQVMTVLQDLVDSGDIYQTVMEQIGACSEADILSALNDTLSAVAPANIHSLRLEEFLALKHSATHGHPPQPSSQPGGPPQFEIIQNQVRTIPGPGGHSLRITPVSRLRVVMVQTGYRRVPGGDPIDSDVVSSAFSHSGRNWFPGVELFGEGIFIDLDVENHPANNLLLAGPVAERWDQAWHNPDEYVSRMMVTEDRNQLHPMFVWWHTLAHRLINALAIDSGYSSAAVRERVFADIDATTGQANGGLLLYTAQPGGDGTLGGLIALVPGFDRVLRGALRNLDACSNDPLCGEEQFGPGKYNGAACYACSLVSETSCEHRNMHLDRNLLLENLP